MEAEVSEKLDSLVFYIYCDEEQMGRWFGWDGRISFHVQAPDGEAFIIDRCSTIEHNRMHEEICRLRLLLLKAENSKLLK